MSQLQPLKNKTILSHWSSSYYVAYCPLNNYDFSNHKPQHLHSVTVTSIQIHIW